MNRANRKTRPHVEAAEPRRLLATFVVTNVNDDGANSLRQAILDANASPGADTIQFNIAGAGPHLIQPLTPLPAITDNGTLIDGYSQPGSSPNTLEMGDNAQLRIRLDGQRTPIAAGSAGLVLNSSDNTVRGLSVTGFGGDAANRFGIVVAANGKTISGNHIYGNWIGLNPDGSTQAPTFDSNGAITLAGTGNTNGIGIRDLFPNTLYPQLAALAGQASGNTIGRIADRTPDSGFGINAERNLVAGASDRPAISAGVQISGAGAFGNVIAGNYIGTNPTGNGSSAGLRNIYGIRLQLGAHDNVIGYEDGDASAPDTRNVIGSAGASLPQGADDVGILLFDAGTSRNRIAGNYVGLQADGDIGGLTFRETAISVNARLLTPNAGNDFDPGTAIEDTLILDNDISNPSGFGVLILGSGTLGTTVRDNRIVNNGEGVVLTLGAAESLIAENVIRDSQFNGVSVGEASSSSTPGFAGGNNRITGNSIFNNGALGIDLVAPNETGGIVTPNDLQDVDASDGSSNYLTNVPNLETAVISGTNLQVSGSINARPNSSYRIEFFANADDDASGSGEGEVFLGFVNVTTGADGNATIPAQSFPAGSLTAGSYISATATNEGPGAETGSTSEFSTAILVTGGETSGTPSASINDVVVLESAGVAVFTVSLSRASSRDILLNIATANGTALSGLDYQTTVGAEGGAIRIPAGQTSATFSVPIIDDLIPEPDEIFFVNISARDSTSVTIADGQGIGTILDDDDDVCIAITSLTDTVIEPLPGGTAFARFQVRLLDANGDPTVSGKVVTVNFRAGVFGDFAESGADYEATAGTLVFQPGENLKVITVPINDDLLLEGPEALTVQLSGETNATLCPPTNGEPTGSTTTTITDNPNASGFVRVLDVQRLGYHGAPTFIVIKFSGPVDPESATNVNNYHLARAGRDRRPGTADDEPVAFASATLSDNGFTVTLRTVKPQPLFTLYRFEINGTQPDGVFDAAGNLIDGDKDRLPGGVFQTNIGRGQGLRDLRRGISLGQSPVLSKPFGSPPIAVSRHRRALGRARIGRIGTL